MTTKTRIHWRAPDASTLHAIVDGQVAGTLVRGAVQADKWTVTTDTLARYPGLYGTGPRALSTWRARLRYAIQFFGVPA